LPGPFPQSQEFAIAGLSLIKESGLIRESGE